MPNKELSIVRQISSDDIRSKIYTIRGIQVMLDSDLAEIYGYETKSFNRQVKNNIERFDEDFMFQLTKEEVDYISRCKNFTSIMQTVGMKGGRVYYPYAFTEQGIYMLMTVLKGELAVSQSKMLVRLFKQMKQYISDNALVFQRLDRIEIKQLETDENFKQIFKQLEAPKEHKAVIFYQGEMYDATSLIEDIIAKAKTEIILIDNYVDKNTLDLLSKKRKNVKINIITSKSGNRINNKEFTDFNNQYGNLTVKISDKFHDRFMILDEKTLYHIGASIKDAGKKAFAITRIDEEEIQHFIKRVIQ